MPRSPPLTNVRFGKRYRAGKKILSAWKNHKKRKYTKKVGLNKVEKKQVKTIIANRKEFKYCPVWYLYDVIGSTGGYLQSALTNPTELPNVWDPAQSAASCYVLQTGRYLNSVSAQVNDPATGVGNGTVYPMGGFGMIRGDSSQNIDGDFAFLHSAKMSITISANVMMDDDYKDAMLPLNFRVIHVRAKKDASGISPSLTNSLFLNELNSRIGLLARTSVKQLMDDFRVNTTQFHKVSEHRFSLNNPIFSALGGTYGTNQEPVGSTMPRNHLPYEKHLDLYVPKVAKKLRFQQTDDGSQNFYEPINYDFVNYVVIIASRSPPFIVTPVGTPLELQNCNSTHWNVRASGITKFREC